MSENSLEEKDPAESRLSLILIQEQVDIETLRRLSREIGGFRENSIRAQVWPKLLNVNKYKSIVDGWNFYENDEVRRQIRCDIDRSLWSTDATTKWEEERRENRRKVLSDIITACLSRHNHLYYYQVSKHWSILTPVYILMIDYKLH